MAKFRDLSKLNKGLSDRAAGDRLRYQQALREAAKENLTDVINELDIFKIDPLSDKKYKVPIQLIEEFRFVYDKNRGDETKSIGQKTGVKKGEVIGKAGRSDEKMPGAGPIAGDKPGEMTLELTLEDLDFVFDEVSRDLNLPFLDPRKLRDIEVKRQSRWRGVKESGIEPRLDIESSFIEKIKRQNMLESSPESLKDSDPSPFPFIGDDLRYHGLGFKSDKQTNALIIPIMDISGSMDKNKRYFVKSFLYALYCLVKTKYQKSEMVFIAHDAEATEVDSDTFFRLSGDGGTIISSGPLKALQIIKERYPLESWNIYVVHCSDGENSSDDNDKTVDAFKKLVEICNLVGFIEVKPGVSSLSRTALQLREEIRENNFRALLINKKSEIGQKFREFLEPDSDLSRRLKDV